MLCSWGAKVLCDHQSSFIVSDTVKGKKARAVDWCVAQLLMTSGCQEPLLPDAQHFLRISKNRQHQQQHKRTEKCPNLIGLRMFFCTLTEFHSIDSIELIFFFKPPSHLRVSEIVSMNSRTAPPVAHVPSMQHSTSLETPMNGLLKANQVETDSAIEIELKLQADVNWF